MYGPGYPAGRPKRPAVSRSCRAAGDADRRSVTRSVRSAESVTALSSEERRAQVQGPQEGRHDRGQLVGAGELQRAYADDQGEGVRSVGPVYIGIMLGLMVLGLLWLVVFYLWGPTSRSWPRWATGTSPSASP